MIGTFLIAYVVVVILEAFFKIREGMKRKRISEMTDTLDPKFSKIPRDYSKRVKEAQQGVNDDTLANRASAEANHMALRSIRQLVADVRYNGYLAGERDKQDGVCVGIGILENPHVHKSGAAQQWARGYCAGQNIVDIRDHIEAA